MRTPALESIDRQLSELNTYVCLSSLFATQFAAMGAETFAASPEMKTVEAFPLNAAARQINVPVGTLSQLSADFQAHLIRQNVARSNECAKDYFDWITLFSHCAFGRALDTKSGYFEGIAKQMGVNHTELCDEELYLTLDHLRCRRNCLVHRNNESNSAYAELCRQKGHAINQFWNKRLASLHNSRVDFQNRDPSDLSPYAFIDLLRLLRLCVEAFDQNYCKKIPSNYLRKYLEEEFQKQVNCTAIDSRRRQKRFVQFARSHFGYELGASEVSLKGKAVPSESALE